MVSLPTVRQFYKKPRRQEGKHGIFDCVRYDICGTRGHGHNFDSELKGPKSCHTLVLMQDRLQYVWIQLEMENSVGWGLAPNEIYVI